MTGSETLGWGLVILGAGGLGYAFVAYPVLLRIFATLAPLPEARATADARPSVTVILACAGERGFCAPRVKNVLAQEYPDLEVILVFDQAPVDEAEVAQLEALSRAVRVVRLERARGKTAAQNLAASLARGEVLVFSDMAAMFEPEAIVRLVAPLADAAIGATCGELCYEGGGVEPLYWRFERALKRLESAFSGLVGANGAIYALRRDQYVPLPDWCIGDFAGPLVIHLLHGARTVYVPGARVREPSLEDGRALLDAKRRITLRAITAMPVLMPCLDLFRRPRLASVFVSHKLVRWAAWLFAAAFVAGLALLGPAGRLVVVGLAAWALWGGACPRRRFAAPAAYALRIVVAQALAFLDLARGRRIAAWRPTHADGENKP